MKTRQLLATLFIALLLLAATPRLGAQSTSGTYQTAIGLRVGETSGLTLKHFMSSRNAIEGLIGGYSHTLSATILYERYAQAFDVEGLNWYYGGGGHMAFRHVHWRNHPHHNHDHEYCTFWRCYDAHDDPEFGLGIDGIFGMEYKIPPIPIAISLELKPYLEFTTDAHILFALDPGLGLKVAF